MPYMDCTLENFNACYYGPILRPYLVNSAQGGYATPDLGAIQRDLQDGMSNLSIYLQRAIAVSERYFSSSRDCQGNDLTKID